MMIKKQVTPFHATSVYDIDVNKLVELDVKYAFVDLDNTLAQFDLITPEKRTYELVKEFKDKGIEIIVLSNNTEKRVAPFVSKLGTSFLFSVRKPFKRKLKKYLINNCITLEESILIGDQLLTDVLLAKNIKMKVCLTEPISKKDQFTTKFNRLIDKPLRKRYRKNNLLGISLDK